MKEIQGKIKFGVIDYNYLKAGGFTITDIPNKEDESFILKNPNICHWYISAITEKQATEFVESVQCKIPPITMYFDYTFGDYMFETAKESLVSLLKENDVYIKEWCMQPNASFTSEESDLYDKLPDDLLLIKL